MIFSKITSNKYEVGYKSMIIDEEKGKEAKRLTNRNIAKLLNQLDEIEIPKIAKDAIIKHMWFLSNDLKNLFGGKNDDGFQQI